MSRKDMKTLFKLLYGTTATLSLLYLVYSIVSFVVFHTPFMSDITVGALSSVMVLSVSTLRLYQISQMK